MEICQIVQGKGHTNAKPLPVVDPRFVKGLVDHGVFHISAMVCNFKVRPTSLIERTRVPSSASVSMSVTKVPSIFK